MPGRLLNVCLAAQCDINSHNGAGYALSYQRRCRGVPIALRTAMQVSIVAATLLAGVALRAESFNINSRYTVENIEIVPSTQPKISTRLKGDIKRLIGERLDQPAIDALRDRLKFETGARAVEQRLVRGTNPNSVKVVFVVERKPRQYDIEIPKMTYYAGQGLSGGVDGVMDANGHRFSVGYMNDGEEKVERFAGVRASYEKRDIAGRFDFRVDVQDYRSQWDSSTLKALGPEGVAGTRPVPGIYRLRRVLQPEVSVHLWNSLVYSLGVSVQSLQMQFPAARTEAANAVIQSLRFHRRWRNAETTQSFEAGYNLHAATTSLASDFAYNRHSWDARYRIRQGEHEVMLAFNAGTLGGRAPLFDRFVAGNSTCLRGWNKYEITPTGKERLAAGTVEYTFKLFQAFYDIGSAWNPGEPAAVRNSLGVGLRAGARGPYLSMAFPLRAGNVTPIFMTTLNF